MVNIPALIGSITGVTVVVTVTGVILWFIFNKKPKRVLEDPKKNVAVRLVDREMINHDTMRLKLGFDDPNAILGLPVGNHCYLSARINGETVVRPYTPVSLDSQKGYVDFVIKVYKANTNANFPRGGKMTQYLASLPLTQYINIRGPGGNLHYLGDGAFDIKPDASSPPKRFNAKYISMICGGSGITPMFQLLRHILENKDDATKIALLFANNSENDILLRDELEIYQTKYASQLRLWYTVTQAPDDWSYSTGYVTDEMLTEHIYPPGQESLVLLCGPTPMVEFACYPNLAKLNYPRDRIFAY